jgi:hypothetical protein
MAPVFRFHDVWLLPAAPDRVFAVLADPDRYPAWWPNIVAVQRIDNTSGILTCRSLLPYALRIEVRSEVVDPPGGRLCARLDGDLVGWSGWTVTGRPGTSGPDASEPGCRVDFRQEVTAPGVPGGRWPLFRPVLDANHRLMMRRGRRGLAAHLSLAAMPPG